MIVKFTANLYADTLVDAVADVETRISASDDIDKLCIEHLSAKKSTSGVADVTGIVRASFADHRDAVRAISDALQWSDVTCDRAALRIDDISSTVKK